MRSNLTLLVGWVGLLKVGYLVIKANLNSSWSWSWSWSWAWQKKIWKRHCNMKIKKINWKTQNYIGRWGPREGCNKDGHLWNYVQNKQEPAKSAKISLSVKSNVKRGKISGCQPKFLGPPQTKLVKPKGGDIWGGEGVGNAVVKYSKVYYHNQLARFPSHTRPSQR